MKTSLSSPHRRAIGAFFAFGLLLLAGLTTGYAQRAPEAPVYRVGKIAVKFIGNAIVSEQVVRANMQVHEGGELDEAMIDRDIRSLYKTGLFEFIEVKREVLPDHTVNLVVEITPKFRVLAVRFEGNKAVKSKRLEKEVKSKPNTSLDERQVKEDVEKLREYYQKSGYNQVSVNYAIDRDRSTGFGTIIFKIKEGAKVKIAAVRFVGNANVKDRRLRKEMETKKWWMFSWLTGSGRFKDEQFEDDLDKLRDFYREQGYLDVEIAPDKISYDYPTPSKLLITIRVVEGRRYRVGAITFSGNKLYSSQLLGRVVRQKSGAIFAPSKLDKDVERLEDFYGRDGYLDTRVRLSRKPNIATGNIDIQYDVNESDKFHVESIVIEGNTKSKSTVILRELTLGPGDVFNSVRMKISKLRLENTRFFDDVNLSPQDTNIPGRRNLRVAVKEGRTGNLTFGAGFSSLERATVFAEVSQSNFDLFNRRSLFQGDGQKFRLRLQLGSLSSEATLSFEEPWFLQRELALGFNLSRQSSDYNSSYYTQVQTNAEVYLRKRLFELVEGRVSYSFGFIDITNVSPDASVYISDYAGKHYISRVGLQLLRDTRDKIINTTMGNRVEFDADVAGGVLGGSEDYYRLEFRGAQFFPIFETQTQVLSLLARAGVIQNYGRSTDVPYYNRFYLGGPTTLRGFEYYDVSPRDRVGEPIGGKSYGMFSAEYSMDIVSPIRFAVFYDAGFVNKGAYDFNPSDYHDNFGFGIRLFVAGAPLSLDLGIPLTGDKAAKKGNQFNFSFGTRF
ncbi:outer membrane protein assembly factor BamA [Horticoccus luteus]|uniref:Outer membrane protein assembly factor BamA n=1 Tax=Horticoccus luteus TaxID=2862869 RepID=A0A8F9TUQ5_9BACT|nr:outer membrane protein assembly factor BamA [Horticoccus luteus]